MFDIIIIGAGTAGLSAAIYGLRAGKEVLVLEEASYGGQIINTPEVENYPGIKNISGFDFATGLFEQAKALGAQVKYEKVVAFENLSDKKVVRTAKGEYESRAVILATGAKPRPLGLPNEKKLIGSGISYCANCDGMFYRGKVVAVNGGGNTAVEDAAFLSAIAKKVYIVHRRDAFRADQANVDILRSQENVEFVLNSTISELVEEFGGLKAIRVVDKISKETREIPVDGLFVAVGNVPENQVFAQAVELDSAGYIKAGEDCRTSAEGIFAAGDTRTKTVRQLATAAGDGAVAGTLAAEYAGRPTQA